MITNFIITTLQQASVTLPDEVNLKPITIPLFVDFSAVAGSASTVFSLISFIGVAATVAIVVFWIYKIVKLGIEGMQSGGKADKIQELIKKLQNIFVGVFMSFLFPVILSIIGIFAGVGTIFEWPRMFRSCESPNYNYYFQAFLDKGGNDAQLQADIECGYGAPNNTSGNDLIDAN